MTGEEAKNGIGVFGIIHAKGDRYPKQLHGKIITVENKYLLFRDNEEQEHIFEINKVISFSEKEFDSNNKDKEDEVSEI